MNNKQHINGYCVLPVPNSSTQAEAGDDQLPGSLLLMVVLEEGHVIDDWMLRLLQLVILLIWPGEGKDLSASAHGQGGNPMPRLGLWWRC